MSTAVSSRRKRAQSFRRRRCTLYFGPAEQYYQRWHSPTCIIVDGPYGVAGFPGDLATHEHLAKWYRPHVQAWTKRSTPQTTLWFWGTEIGWASVHPLLAENDWEYRCCHIWDKGMSHIAGNANSKTLRKFPVVTEVCVQYTKAARFLVRGQKKSMQQWLRAEWMRTGLPLRLANQACGVANAATRKYLTSDHLWYYPPPEAFEKLAKYANSHGEPQGRPYFSVNGMRPLDVHQWSALRSKFNCRLGVTNVWRQPQVNGDERIQGQRDAMKYKFRCLHGSQKPINLIDLIVRACTEVGDVVWEPFGGLCPGAVVCYDLDRQYYAAETAPEFFAAAKHRLARHAKTRRPSL